MDEQKEFMEELFFEMAGQLMSIGTDDFGEKDFEAVNMGNTLHLQVKDMKGEVCLQVVGSDSDEIAEQLLLACFHNISIEHLGALHMRPLNRGLQVGKTKG